MTLLPIDEAARALEKALAGFRGDVTVADASARSGLALRDAERGLHALVRTYRGHLKATSSGELLFSFPRGLTKPWEVPTPVRRAAGAGLRFAKGALRFLLRAWISIVLVAYAVAFLILIIGAALARSSADRGGSSRRDDPIGPGAWLVMRMVTDALFWTFHPLSPVSVAYRPHHPGFDRAWRARAATGRARRDETPFYEKVNRFVFGPEKPRPDSREMERRLVAEIRAQKGRIGLADVMRVTGLPRDEADPLMARLLLDYDGDVGVSEEGGIVYRFEALRRTAGSEPAAPRPSPVWSKLKPKPPLTGNGPGANLAIVALNGLNLAMSLYAIDAGLTLDNASLLLRGVPMHELPAAGTPIVLGVVPLVFSIAIFAMPLLRALWIPIERRRVARENGRRALLRAILGRTTKRPIPEPALVRAWEDGAGAAPDPKELQHELVALGADAQIADDGSIRYRFPDLEIEAAALEAEREAASEEEARVGKVVFSSDE